MITPLRHGVDTLEATFSHDQFPDDLREMLERKKLEAKLDNAPSHIFLNNRHFYLGTKGRGLWQYVARNDEMEIRFSTAANVPPMAIKLFAHGLATEGVRKLWKQVRGIAELYGFMPLNLTRIDIALDFQGWTPTFEEMLNVVCSASFRPIYPSTTRPETFQFGRGDVVVRLYNKTKEIVYSGKEWWKFVWRACGGFCEDGDVWRIEVQLRSKAIKEFGLYSVEDAIESTREFFGYGLDWCSLRAETDDSNLRRRPLHPAWEALKAAYAPAEPISRVRSARQLMGYEQARKRFQSAVLGAAVAMDTTDYERVVRCLYDDTESYIERELDTDFAELVLLKIRKDYE